MIAVSPSRLVYEYLRTQGYPETGWKMSYDEMPADGNLYITAFNTEGVSDGKDMRTGQALFHHGVTVTVRHPDQDAARSKAVEIVNSLEGVRLVPVSVGGTDVVFQAFHLTGDLSRVGEDDKRRERYNINGLVTARVAE